MDNKINQCSGFIAVLDILGFKAYLQDNPAVTAAAEVVTTMQKLLSAVPTDLVTRYGLAFHSEIDLCFLSDTILLSMPISPSFPGDKFWVNYEMFFRETVKAYDVLFANRFPSRAAISFGDFTIIERATSAPVHCGWERKGRLNVYTGKAIAEAATDQSRLDASGIVLSQSIVDRINDGSSNHPEIWNQVFDYTNESKFMLKRKCRSKLLALFPFCSPTEAVTDRDQIRSRFRTAKAPPDADAQEDTDVEKKIENTIRYFNYAYNIYRSITKEASQTKTLRG
jgi:hypothetical protein